MDSNGSTTISGRPVPDRARRMNVDLAMVHLVRVILDDGWTAPDAARQLLEVTGDDHELLRRMRAKILRGSMDAATPVTQRALVTLDLATSTSVRATSRPRPRPMDCL